MKTLPHNSPSRAPACEPAEETLRLVAGLPAPAGLEDRVRAALHLARVEDSQRQPNGSGPNGAGVDRRGRVLAWPVDLKPRHSWMRTAAAAAIVFVVAGGGWGVYTRVEQSRPGKVIVMPLRVGAPGGFSGASAVRTPQTVTGPTVIQPAKPKPAPPKTQGAAPATTAAPASDSTVQAAPQR
jgi:hypothetical protein